MTNKTVEQLRKEFREAEIINRAKREGKEKDNESE